MRLATVALMAWLMAHSAAFLIAKLNGPATIAGASSASWNRIAPFERLFVDGGTVVQVECDDDQAGVLEVDHDAPVTDPVAP